jgi:hypothetical protein
MSRRSVITIDEFYEKIGTVRRYALRQQYYTPYETASDLKAKRRLPTWWATGFKSSLECPFKSSLPLRTALESIVDEQIDMAHWAAPFDIDDEFRPRADTQVQTCLWNCCFHVKLSNSQKMGDGVHNHVTDAWNSVGEYGWVGIIYLCPNAPLDGGLYLWRNRDPNRNFDWMTAASNWEQTDTFANIANRLILVRGDLPHSGAGGWGNSLETGRMFQTFFFKTVYRRSLWPVSILHGETQDD